MRSITRKFKIIAVLTFLAALTITSPVYASITVGSNGLYLGYEDGSYYYLKSGTYQSISRIDNVWYVNGLPITQDYTGTTNAIFNNWYIALGLLIIIPVIGSALSIILLLKNGGNPKVVLMAVPTLIGMLIWFIIGIIIMIQFQAII